jgi:hypothetical protein
MGITMKRGDAGEVVKKLQEALVELGYPLPRWGTDGELGMETLEALARLLQDHTQPLAAAAVTVTDAQLAFVYRLLDRQRGTLARPQIEDGMFFDVRASADRRFMIQRRAWSEVTGICLHQTACNLGERPQRWATIGAHLGVTRAGRVIWMHDLHHAIVHGNGFNTNTVGIEMEGSYPGIEGNLSTFWRTTEQPQSPTAELVAAARATVRWICAEVANHGGKVTSLVAHRQASDERQADPGSALWQQVALPLMSELSLSDGGPGFKIDSGSPIPEAWDASRTGVRY